MPLHQQDEEDMNAEAVIARAIARRGEIFDEFRLLAQESPRTYDLISRHSMRSWHAARHSGSITACCPAARMRNCWDRARAN
jgi:hypothetical protein